MQQMEREAQTGAQAFLKAHNFLRYLKKHNGDLKWHEYKTLRGQALSGDVEGAATGLRRILMKKGADQCRARDR